MIIVMSNTKENEDTIVTLIGKTIRDNDYDSTALIIPKSYDLGTPMCLFRGWMALVGIIVWQYPDIAMKL